jgi:hypothetical protein
MQTRVLMAAGFLFEFGPSGDAPQPSPDKCGDKNRASRVQPLRLPANDCPKTSLFLQRIRNNRAGKAALRQCNSAADN